MPDAGDQHEYPTFPRRAAIIGAAGGLGQGLLSVCREEGIAFTAVVRSRPERIKDVPEGSRVVVVESLADRASLVDAFSGSDAVLTAMGVTSTSRDDSAMLSANLDRVEAAMIDAGVDRLVIINTLVRTPPGAAPSLPVRLFRLVPGNVGRGMTEMQAVADALGKGALSAIRWTLVRAGIHPKGRDESPVAAAQYDRKVNSWKPVSYRAMARWMLEEAVANRFVRQAPVVSRHR
jgi:nucleoside-diphosphate-sugar epimerase